MPDTPNPFDIWLSFAPAHGFVRWLAAHPGYVIVSTLTGRREFPGNWSLLMELRGQMSGIRDQITE